MLLRPEPPGGLVQHGGDIDNRLKTLFDHGDSSAAPAVTPNAQPDQGESPFFCVLDDDRRITKLRIHTERLWEPVESPDEVELIMLELTIRNRREPLAIYVMDDVGVAVSEEPSAASQ